MKQATLTGKQAKKLLEVFEDTPSDQMQHILESGLLADLRDTVIAAINRDEFRRVCGLKSLTPEFLVWRTLTIGGVSMDELLERLESAGHGVSSSAGDIMRKPEFTTLPEPTQIQLAKAQIEDFGFTMIPTMTELFARIREVGDLCPAEVGPHLRLADQDQPKEIWYWIAMEPVTDSDGDPRIFVVCRRDDGERWLDAGHASPDDRLGLRVKIVFCLHKPA